MYKCSKLKCWNILTKKKLQVVVERSVQQFLSLKKYSFVITRKAYGFLKAKGYNLFLMMFYLWRTIHNKTCKSRVLTNWSMPKQVDILQKYSNMNAKSLHIISSIYSIQWYDIAYLFIIYVYCKTHNFCESIFSGISNDIDWMAGCKLFTFRWHTGKF